MTGRSRAERPEVQSSPDVISSFGSLNAVTATTRLPWWPSMKAKSYRRDATDNEEDLLSNLTLG
jgi:hypothetical protein